MAGPEALPDEGQYAEPGLYRPSSAACGRHLPPGEGWGHIFRSFSSTWSAEVRLVMGTLLLMTPTVFFTIQRLFDTVYDARFRLAARVTGTWRKRFQKNP